LKRDLTEGRLSTDQEAAVQKNLVSVAS